MKARDHDLAAVCRHLRRQARLAVAVHEDPDLDALGAAAGLLDAARQLGIEARLHVLPDVRLPELPAPLPAGAVVTTAPAAGTALYALDSGSRDRLAVSLEGWQGEVVNIDHHHDNTRFGDLALVRGDASSTSELVADVLRALDLRPSPPAAADLYAGISFDSGHFRHDSTAATTFRTAAWLVECGVDVTAVYAHLYERRSLAGLRLWARAVLSAQPVAGGRGLVAVLTHADFAACGADEGETEGIVESLRAVAGVEVAALVKERPDGGRVRVSLRSSGLDVSAVAALRGGGGHRLAAGFSCDDPPGEVSAWLSSELARRLSTASC